MKAVKYIGWLFVTAILIGGLNAGHAQTRVVLGQGSTLWIDGTSTVSRYTCEAGQVQGYGLLPPQSSSHDPEARVLIDAASFDCGKRRMNRDFDKALKTDDYPVVSFQLDDVRSVGDVPDGTYHLQADGVLTLAGTTRQISVEVVGERRPDGMLEARGAVPLRMTDFGITPPKAMLGLIRAHDDIVVRFDLIASIQTTTAAAMPAVSSDR